MRIRHQRPRGLGLAGLCIAALSRLAVTADVGAVPAQQLIDSATAEMRNDPEASRRDAAAALEQLQRTPDADLEVRARLLLCDYFSERDRAAAEQQITAAEALLPRARRAGLRAGILTCHGETLEAAGDNTQAHTLFDQAVASATQTHDDDLLAEALFSRGYLLGVQGEYATGLADLRRSQALFDKLGKPVHALTVLNSIATLYNQMGDYTEAARIYQATLSEQRKGNMRRDQAVTLHNLGRAHEKLGQWQSARDDYGGALALFQEINYPRGIAYALRGLAMVDNAEHAPALALPRLDRASVLAVQAQDARLGAQIQLARGIALHQLARLADSASALQKALTVFRQADSQSELSDTLNELATVQAELGDWRAAYDSRTQAQQLGETLLRNQLDQRFASLKVEFDTATRDHENALLSGENQANQQALQQSRRAARLQTAVITLSSLLLVMLTTLVVYQWRNSRRMRALALTDELTGLPNRRALLARLAELLLRPHAGACALLIADLDHFKSINDRHGHPVGDETLRRVSAALLDGIREPDFVGRLGGEEFALVFANTTVDAACEAAERLRMRVRALDFAPWFTDRRLTISIGVTAAQAGDTVSSMLRRADRALYAAKHAGRDRVQIELPEVKVIVARPGAQAT